MKYIKFIVSIFTIFSLSLTSSCVSRSGEGEDSTSHSKDDDHNLESNDINNEEDIHLSKEQIETIGLKFGPLLSIKVNDFVKATGTLGLPPNAYSSVSTKANGIIKGSKKYVEGNYIKEGEIVAYLENPDFIVTQQEYLEAKALLKLKQLEAERQKTLVESNAGIMKNLQNAQAEVEVLEAKTQGLAKQLSFLGIPTSNLSPNNIRQQISIEAPMSGYISKISFHNGMYAQATISLMDIISSQHLHLELDVFEKDIAKIIEGQRISYTVPALGETLYQGEVSVIGKEFNKESKTVRIHGHLEGTKPKFLKDLFLNAKIWLNDNTTDALPENAIIKDGGNTYIYVAKNEEDSNEIEFHKISIIPGPTENGFTAVKLLDSVPDGMQIVTNGAYYVYAQSKAGELEHEH